MADDTPATPGRLPCPDGAICRHDCSTRDRCWRVDNAGPLSGVYPDDEWPDYLVDSGPPVICATCGHPESHHDAGECWTDADGNETHGETACGCSWWEPAGVPVSDDTPTPTEYPECRPGFVLGYYEGWADAKAGRQYGEGPHGQRSGHVPVGDDTPATTTGRYAEARRVYDMVKRDGQRVLTLPEIQRVIDACRAGAAPDLTALLDAATAALAEYDAIDAYDDGDVDWHNLSPVEAVTMLAAMAEVLRAAVAALVREDTDHG